MKSGSAFLLAARQCEIAELEQLARTVELVAVLARLIHALQRERGISNIFLSSRRMRFGAQRLAQVDECDAVELDVRAHLEQLQTDAGPVRNGSRLFSRVAVVLHGLDGLLALRESIARQELSAVEATAAFSRLLAGLLAVVFEAADSATDPEISRALVALFNFMQGKELAGQERALGARVFAGGRADPAHRQQWSHLIESQQACFQAFGDFTAADMRLADQAARDPEVLARLEQLRRIGCTEDPLDSELTAAWYACCTSRIDAMKSIEDMLAVHLRGLCERRIAQARTELQDQRVLLQALAAEAEAAAGGPLLAGPHVERSMLALVQEQSRRLQAMGDELEAVRTTLNERKLVERAKGLLMAHRQLSEDDAYKTLRQLAMNQNRRIVDVAQAVLSLAEVLPR